MINIVEFDTSPLTAGEIRKFILSGDGPFTVSTRCFVDKPRPPGPGFLPCPECADQVVQAGVAGVINCSKKLWSVYQGAIEVSVSNAQGEVVEFSLSVLPDVDSTPNVSVSA